MFVNFGWIEWFKSWKNGLKKDEKPVEYDNVDSDNVDSDNTTPKHTYAMGWKYKK